MNNNINRIIDESCKIWGVSKEDVFREYRSMPIPLVRAACAWNIVKHLGLGYSATGRALKKSHTAIIHYMSVYKNEYKYNKDFRIFADKLSEFCFELRNEFQQELDEELMGIIG